MRASLIPTIQLSYVLKIVFVISLLLGLISCTPPRKPLNTAQDVFRSCTTNADPYKKTEWLSSPAAHGIQNKKIGYIEVGYRANFRSLCRFGDVEPILYQIYIVYNDAGWAFLESAVDSDGEKMDLVQISRDVLRGSFITEHVALTVSREYLEARKIRGISARIYGSRRNIDIVLPSIYIDGFLKYVDARNSLIKPTSSSRHSDRE